MTGTQAVTVETLARVPAAFDRHDLDALMTCFAEDAVLELPRGADPWGTRCVGKAAVRAGLAGRFAVRGCNLWEFRDGLIARKDSSWKIVG